MHYNAPGRVPLSQLPESFDARSKWPLCSTIGKVHDDGGCRASWAISTTSMISDRMCINYEQQMDLAISARNLIACCKDCGNKCSTGSPTAALQYWIDEGIVTGGNYNDNSTCQPYPFPKCAHVTPSNYSDCPESSIPPECDAKCSDEYKIQYQDDKYYGVSQKTLPPNETLIMQEIYEYGPVVSTFTNYADFDEYSGGIYRHAIGFFYAENQVKLIGWGVEDNVKYWLGVNTWNEEWGEKGLFKFLRGEDMCGIESGVIAAIPQTI